MHIEVSLVLILSALIGIALVPLFFKKQGLLAGSLSFATGTLLAIVLGHVIPEVLAKDHQLSFGLIAGFMSMMLLNHYLFHSDPCCDHDATHSSHAHEEKLSLCTVGAMTVCTVNDGFILGHQEVSFSSALLWSMVAHKLTAAFGLYTMVKVCAQKKRLSHVILLGLFVLLTPLVYILVAEKIIPPSQWMDVTLSVSAGMLLYVVSVVFIPRCNEFGHGRPRTVIMSLFLGVILTMLLSHGDHHGHYVEDAHDHGEVHDHDDGHGH